ncbi:MAG: DUF2865 domain-containing protein [Xanthobacteraceae bacterium]
MFNRLRSLGHAGHQAALGATFSILASSALAQGYPPQAYPAQNYPPQGYPGPAAAVPQASNQPAPNQPTQYQRAQNQPSAIQPALNPATSNPVCVRLEGQLASFDRGTADPGRAAQIQQAQDAIAKQQADLDRAVAQAHKAGCAGQGFFALFSALSPQCGPITSQIQQMRGNLDRMMSDLEQLKSGSTDQADQRRALIGQLAQNNCGAQYTAAANSQGGPQGFFDALFGGGTIVNPNGDGAPNGTYHTVCVRTCDGYYFPVSYSTLPTHFAEDELTCQRECPAANVALYSYRNPGESMEQAVSTNGQLYTALPTAFHYRTQLISGCSCRRPGESWEDALKNADDSSTLESGDIVVTDQNAKALSQPPKQPGAKLPPATAAHPLADAPSTATASTTPPDNPKRPVRVVGPPFLSPSQMEAQPPSH